MNGSQNDAGFPASPECLRILSSKRVLYFGSGALAEATVGLLRGCDIAVEQKNDIESVPGWKDFDLILEGGASASQRTWLNRQCIEADRAWLSASMQAWSGYTALFQKQSGCLECVFPEGPQRTTEARVLPAPSACIAGVQATEAIKTLLGQGSLKGCLLALTMHEWDYLKLRFRPNQRCGCQTGQWDSPETPVVGSFLEIDAHEAYRAIQKGHFAQIVDVRSEEEFQQSHIPGSICIPLTDLPHHKFSEPTLFICAKGIRSATAVRLCPTGTSLRGGVAAWADAGLPLES